MSTTDSVTLDVQRLLGQVKWFNNKAGYGFITVNDGEQAGKDIFIHYSSIAASESQYKYLVQGEYVEFVLDKSASDTHEFQATQVSGIKGGKLMCETRRIAQVNADVTERPRGEYRRYRVSRDAAAPAAAAAPLGEEGAPTSQPTDSADTEFTKVERKPRGRGTAPRASAGANRASAGANRTAPRASAGANRASVGGPRSKKVATATA
jgi:cold shock CspA family protein